MSSFGRLFTPALAERLSVRTPAGTTPTTPSTDTSTQGPDPVGVRDVVTAQSRLRVRVYYPADRGTLDSSANPAKFFKDPLAAVLKGHLHTMSSLRAGTTAFNVAAVALQAATSVLPLAYATLPSAWHDIQPLKARDSGFPVLLFSHGLTGTGEEHATLFCHLARTGYVVACIHHCDGSSSRAVLPDGSDVYYDFPPGMNGRPGIYPADFRTEQVERREVELSELYQFVVAEGGLGETLPVDPRTVVAGGFSYGAATAALAVAKAPHRFAAAMLLDGWFNVDLKSIKGCTSNEQVAFPPLAHVKGLGAVPALFVGSAEFAGYTALHAATVRLSQMAGPGTEMHTIPNTTHFSFMDLVCWLSFLAPRLYGRANAPDPAGSYEHLFDLTSAFLHKISKL